MQKKVINLGLAGFGTVGTGLARIIQENSDWIKRRLGKELKIQKILVRDPDKKRSMIPGPETKLVTDPRDLVHDPEVDMVVELMGGLETAHSLITSALKEKKHVVTANKALLAEKGNDLFALAREQEVGLYYEASVAGGIPIVQTLKESLSGDRIKSLTGILNGTANFILSEMTRKGQEFETALQAAKDLGYAEADPSLDIDGLDAAHKLTLLIRLAYGVDYPLNILPVQGISGVRSMDIAMAAEFGCTLKLIAQVREKSGHLQAGVFPALLANDHILAKVEGPYNSILIDGNAVGQVMLYGQGAGDLPTGSAVLSDILALARDNAVPNNTGFLEKVLPKAEVIRPEVAVSRHYFRFTAQDKPGVLAAVAGVMSEYNISIAQVVQREALPQGGGVPIVFLTHKAQAEAVQRALAEIDRFDFTIAPAVHYRILG
ncbi:homoserine dehydrogenase [Desulfonatronospira sp.]|uniref:homoserine dehydrogenase n=1 Tax=Desulfonatronospira sp. TaxID=1962951 RepID=UPI0025BD4D6E|nr:homoserine dehydrogenase [Desulfonatronospira sp.]